MRKKETKKEINTTGINTTEISVYLLTLILCNLHVLAFCTKTLFDTMGTPCGDYLTHKNKKTLQIIDLQGDSAEREGGSH